MKRIIKVKVNKRDFVPKTKLTLLMNNMVDSFFPISLIGTNKEIAYFDITNYVSIKEINKLTIYEFYEIFEMLLFKITLVEDYMFKANELVLSQSTIFIKRDNYSRIYDLKLLYIHNDLKNDIYYEILNVISSLKSKIKDDTIVYANELYKYIINLNPGYKEIISYIETKKQEIKTFEKY